MVKTIVLKKISWFKNDDDKGGAQNKAIQVKKDGEIIIHSQTRKNGRIWACVKPEKLCSLIEKNNGLYEVITSFPHKVYFDIDKKGECDASFLENIKKEILNIFVDAKFAVSGSITKEKSSFHIVLQNYQIRNKHEQLVIKSIAKYFHSQNDAFDWKVYTKNRNMKCINQSKLDGRVQEIIENPDMKHHLITCYMNDLSLQMPVLKEEIEDFVLKTKSKTAFDLGMLPKIILKEDKMIDFTELTAIDVLSMLPLNSDFDFQYTHLVARFCFYNNVGLDLFVSWVMQKHEHDECEFIKQKWFKKFENMSVFPPVYLEQIKSILCYFYPHLKKDIHYKRFEKAFDLEDTKIKKIETISQKEFFGFEKYSVFNIGMGGGKTTQTISYLKKCKSFCWIAPNRSLAKNTFNRLIECGIEDCKYYDTDRVENKKNGSLTGHDKIIIVGNSLSYLFEKTYDVIVIDEIETVLEKWHGSFMNERDDNKKRQNWKVFKNVLNKSRKVILLDAFITKLTVNFIKNLSKNNTIVIYERLVNHSMRTVRYVKDHEKMIKNIIDDLKNSLKVFIFYPYKKEGSFKSMKNLCDCLTEQTGKRGEFYNADIDDTVKNKIKDVNMNWGELDFVMVNNMITCGINYEKKDFDKVYLFVAKFNSPRDIIQVSYRPRFIESGLIMVCFMGKMSSQTAWENDVFQMDCNVYAKLSKDLLIEKKSPLRKTFQLFCKKAYYKQETDKNNIDEKLKDEICEMLDKYKNSINYEHITDIDCQREEELQNLMFSGEATMMNKFEMEKYYYKQKFKNDTDELKLSEAWNSGYLSCLDKIRKVL